MRISEWKEEAVKCLEDMRHRPSREVVQQAERLLREADEHPVTSPGVDRRVAELHKALTRYNRNAERLGHGKV